MITIAFARRLVAEDGFFAIEEPDRLLVYDGDPDAPEGWLIVGRTIVCHELTHKRRPEEGE